MSAEILHPQSQDMETKGKHMKLGIIVSDLEP